MDFVSGSSCLNALKSALDAGWRVYFHSALHAKVYLLDDVVILGSGNLTGNGMNLLSSPPNIELNAELSRNSEIEELVGSVVENAAELNPKVLNRMKGLISQVNSSAFVECDAWWPSSVGLRRFTAPFCSDFPSRAFNSSIAELEQPWSSLEVNLKIGKLKSAKKELETSNAYLWLISKIHEKGEQCRFGYLSAVLHRDLMDDPLPYRKSVKQLLANLLSFVEACPASGIRVSRPNHTQIVSLN